jgi:hypothetical protein
VIIFVVGTPVDGATADGVAINLPIIEKNVSRACWKHRSLAVDMGGGSSISASGQYVDQETCRQLVGRHFDESMFTISLFHLLFSSASLEELFEVFVVKVVPRNIVEQLIKRPTVEDLQSCRSELGDMIRTTHCGPILVSILLLMTM